MGGTHPAAYDRLWCQNIPTGELHTLYVIYMSLVSNVQMKVVETYKLSAINLSDMMYNITFIKRAESVMFHTLIFQLTEG